MKAIMTKGDGCPGEMAFWSDKDLIRRHACPLCGDVQRHFLRVRKDGLSLFECEKCRLAYLDPVPTEAALDSFYANGYFSGEKDFFSGQNYFECRDNSIQKEEPVTGFKEVMSMVDIKGKSILDVGCASGALLKQFQQHGAAKLVGVDISHEAVSFGREKYGLELYCGKPESISLAPESFDLITAVDLWEHVREPMKFLQVCFGLLKPSGQLFIITPNSNARKLTRTAWIQNAQSYEHLHYFEKNTACYAAKMTGFSVKKIRTRGLPISLAQYTESLSGPKFMTWQFYFNAAVKIIFFIPSFMTFGNDLILLFQKDEKNERGL